MVTRKRILILSDDFPPYIRGGAGAIAGSDAVELHAAGHEVLVVTTIQDASLAGTFVEDEINVVRVFAPAYHPRWRAYISLYNPTVLTPLREIIREFKPEIVLTHNIHEYISYGALRLAKKSAAKVFLTAHDVMLVHYGKMYVVHRVTPFEQLREYRFWYNPFRNLVIQHALKNVTKVFTVSNALKRALELNGIKNIAVIYNGIDPSAWQHDSEQEKIFKKKHNLEHKKVILFSGRISGAKGGDVLIDAVQKVVEQMPESMLVLAGKETEYTNKLMIRATERGLKDHITITGWLNHQEMSAAYYSADVVVVPSMSFDSLPTTVLEAMVCSKPVVGSFQGGIPEMIRDEETGYIIHPHSPEFSERMLAILNNPAKALEMGHAGNERVRSVFSIAKKLDTYCEFF